MKALEITWAKLMDMQCIYPCKSGMPQVLLALDTFIVRGDSENMSFELDVSAVGSIKQNLSGKECDKALGISSFDCYHALPLPYGAVCWSAVHDCDISWSYSLSFKRLHFLYSS